MTITTGPLAYRSVVIVDPLTGNQATVVAGALTTSGGGGGGGSVTQGTTPWVVSGQGTAGTAATGVVTVQGIASMTKLLVTPDSVALPANQSVNVNQLAGTTTSVNNGTVDAGTLRVTLASNSTGQVALTSGAQVQPIPGTSGGLSLSSTLTPNNNTAVVVKSGAGQLYHVEGFNNSAVIAYLKVYNATSATAGSGTPVWRCMIPAATAGGAGFVSVDCQGLAFSTGITYVVVTDYADNGTTAPAASAYIVNMAYK